MDVYRVLRKDTIVPYISKSDKSEISKSSPIELQKGEIIEHNGECFGKILDRGISFLITIGAIRRALSEGILEEVAEEGTW